MADHTPYQKRIIERFYDQRDKIALARLGEIVTEIYLADTEARLDQLWKRVEKEMAVLQVPNGISQHILGQRNPEVLARNLKRWLKKSQWSR